MSLSLLLSWQHIFFFLQLLLKVVLRVMLRLSYIGYMPSLLSLFFIGAVLPIKAVSTVCLCSLQKLSFQLS